MEIGISTFVETTPNVKTGEVISHAQQLREVVEEIELADPGAGTIVNWSSAQD